MDIDMQYSRCPLCEEELEVREVAPCACCGHLPKELLEFQNGRHTYSEMRIFGDLTLVLCDFCQVDFGSMYPEFFGLPSNARIGYGKMQFVRSVHNIGIGKDKYCSECGYRLAFLKFVAAVRQANEQGSAAAARKV